MNIGSRLFLYCHVDCSSINISQIHDWVTYNTYVIRYLFVITKWSVNHQALTVYLNCNSISYCNYVLSYSFIYMTSCPNIEKIYSSSIITLLHNSYIWMLCILLLDFGQGKHLNCNRSDRVSIRISLLYA